MISGIFNFIKDKFDAMPEWLQIITFILFLACFFGLLFSPKYIDIRLVGTLGEGEFPLAEAKVEIETEDRVITMVTDGKGRFSVPIGLANPITDYTFVLYPDSKTKRQVDVNVGGHKAFTDWNKLTYSREKDEYKFTSTLTNPFISNAYAQDNLAKFRSKDNIDDVVIDAISKTTGLKTTEISLKARLSEDLLLSNYDLSYINHRLNSEFGIDAWEKIWDNAKSPEDIVGISRALYYQDKPWGDHLVSRNKNISRLLSESKEKYPHNIYEEFLSARILRKSGNNEKAIKVLNNILVKEPDFYLAKYNQALAYDAISKTESAKSAYQEAIEIQTKQKFEDASLYNTYGRFLYRNGMYKNSLKAYLKVKEIEPGRDFSDEYITDSLNKLGCNNIEVCVSEKPQKD